MHTREIAAYGGLVKRMPIYAAFFMVFTMANVGLPGTSGFIGEFLTLLAAFKANTWVAFLGDDRRDPLGRLRALSLSARDLRRAGEAGVEDILDLTPREIGIFAPLVALTIFFGFYPAPVLDVTATSVKKLVPTTRRRSRQRRAAAAWRRPLRAGDAAPAHK